ncbi:MAG: beta-lactamase, partial [Paenibacillaceae bacterium]|nr:beta-lactamase [Paenibacillaceae bacterium]
DQPEAEWLDNVARIKVPLPFPLQWVNSYAIRGKQGITLIDPGLHTEASIAVWEETFERLAFAGSDIERIVLTHYHPDHYGLAGWMQQLSGADVWLSRSGHEQAQRLWGAGQPLTIEIVAQFRRAGMPEELLAQVKQHLDDFVPLVSPQPVVRMLEPGIRFTLGDEEYETIEAGGHAIGQICFYRESSGIMFCGDQVLPKISPNISLIPGAETDPLGSFLGSLQQLASYKVALAYPGHRDPFADFTGRTLELLAHHEERLMRMLDQLREPLTAYGLCRRIFGDRLSVHQLRFALAETLAHVEHLRLTGRVVRESVDVEGTARGRGSAVEAYTAIGG